MSRKEYQSRIRELAFTYFAAPTVILVGMFGVGAVIDIMSNTSNTFSYLFSVIGGVPGIGLYYYKEWKNFINKQVPKNELLENQKKILEILNNIKEKLLNG